MVEVDSGQHRNGVARPRALDRSRRQHGASGLGRRNEATLDDARALQEAEAALRRVEVGAGLRSGRGSTPTAALVDEGALNGMRPGAYVFNDAQQVELGAADWDAVASDRGGHRRRRHGRDLIV